MLFELTLFYLHSVQILRVIGSKRSFQLQRPSPLQSWSCSVILSHDWAFVIKSGVRGFLEMWVRGVPRLPGFYAPLNLWPLDSLWVLGYRARVCSTEFVYTTKSLIFPIYLYIRDLFPLQWITHPRLKQVASLVSRASSYSPGCLTLFSLSSSLQLRRLVFSQLV